MIWSVIHDLLDNNVKLFYTVNVSSIFLYYLYKVVLLFLCDKINFKKNNNIFIIRNNFFE